MIVFSYEQTEQQPGQPAETDEVDLSALDDVTFLLIPGSARSASRNNAVLRAARSLAPRSVRFDGLMEMPQFNPDDDPESSSAVSDLRAMVADADVVLFCTPEYAGSLPGSLKNVIDWTVGTGDLYQKPVASINVAATGRGAGAGHDLARVLGYVDAHVLEPGGLQLPLDPASLGPDHEVVDEDYRDRLLRGLVRLATAYQRRGR